MLGNVRVQARIAELELEAVRRAEVDADMVVRELSAIAFYDVRELFEEVEMQPATVTSPAYTAIRLKPTKDWSPQVARAVASLKVRRYSNPENPVKDHDVIEIKLANKLPALELLAKMTGAIPKESPRQADEDFHLHVYGGPMGFDRPRTEG
jgi:hypothetical protein